MEGSKYKVCCTIPCVNQHLHTHIATVANNQYSNLCILWTNVPFNTIQMNNKYKKQPFSVVFIIFLFRVFFFCSGSPICFSLFICVTFRCYFFAFPTGWRRSIDIRAKKVLLFFTRFSQDKHELDVFATC